MVFRERAGFCIARTVGIGIQDFETIIANDYFYVQNKFHKRVRLCGCYKKMNEAITEVYKKSCYLRDSGLLGEYKQ